MTRGLFAGALDQRVTIQLGLATRDGDGGAGDLAWQDVATVWAAVEDVAGTEGAAQGALTSATRRRVRLRWLAWLTNRHRLVWRGRVLAIEAVRDPEQRRRELLVDCVEHAGGV